MVDIEQLYKGKQFTICGVVVNGRSLLKSFIKALDRVDKTKVLYLLQRTADYGLPQNLQKFRKIVGEELWEFKAGQVRILCFFEKDRIIICTHGFIKKKDKTPAKEIDRAKELMKLYRKGRRKK